MCRLRVEYSVVIKSRSTFKIYYTRRAQSVTTAISAREKLIGVRLHGTYYATRASERRNEACAAYGHRATRVCGETGVPLIRKIITHDGRYNNSTLSVGQ